MPVFDEHGHQRHHERGAEVVDEVDRCIPMKTSHPPACLRRQEEQHVRNGADFGLLETKRHQHRWLERITANEYLL